MPDGETQWCIHHDYQIRLGPVNHPNLGLVLGDNY